MKLRVSGPVAELHGTMADFRPMYCRVSGGLQVMQRANENEGVPKLGQSNVQGFRRAGDAAWAVLSEATQDTWGAWIDTDAAMSIGGTRYKSGREAYVARYVIWRCGGLTPPTSAPTGATPGWAGAVNAYLRSGDGLRDLVQGVGPGGLLNGYRVLVHAAGPYDSQLRRPLESEFKRWNPASSPGEMPDMGSRTTWYQYGKHPSTQYPTGTWAWFRVWLFSPGKQLSVPRIWQFQKS
jgi:hypothetical protein